MASCVSQTQPLVVIHALSRERYTLRSFTGEDDAPDTPILRDGDLQTKSVYRFKRPTAAVVVLTEIDFAVLDALCWRKLFVEMTLAFETGAGVERAGGAANEMVTLHPISY